MVRWKAGLGRLLAAPLLLFNLACAIVILGIAGKLLDRGINNGNGGGTLTGFSGNGAAPYLEIFSIIAAAVAIASYIVALHHLRVWGSDSGAASIAAAWIAWLLLVIAFCLAWKAIDLGGLGSLLATLVTFVIILTVTHFLLNLVLHIGDHGDAGSDGHGKFRKPLNPNYAGNTGTGATGTPAASAV